MVPISNWGSEYREDALQVYDFSPSSSYMDHCTFLAPRLVRTFALPISRKGLRDASLLTHVASLDMPCLYDRCRDSVASTRSSFSASGSHGQPSFTKKPFYDSSAAQLCSIVLSGHGKEGWAYLFLVHTKTLLTNRFNEYFDAAPDEPIPWSIWGAQNAACLYGPHFAQRDLWDSHGDRVAILEPEPSHSWHTAAEDEASNTVEAARDASLSGQLPQPTMWRLIVLDFNQDRVHRFLHKESWPKDDDSPTPRRNVRPPRVMRGIPGVQERLDEHFFVAYEEPIMATLPYIEVVHPKKIMGSKRPRISIDSEHVILNYVSIFTICCRENLQRLDGSSTGHAIWV